MEIKQNLKANYYKKLRLFKRIKQILTKKNVLFLTFTFNDKTLNKTTLKTRERYIKQFLNSQTSEYILNCDYGETGTKRQHFHAVAVPLNHIKGVNLKIYKYGRINAEYFKKSQRFKYLDRDLNKCAKVLLNHTIKPSTQNTRIIYSRRLKKDKENIF